MNIPDSIEKIIKKTKNYYITEKISIIYGFIRFIIKKEPIIDCCDLIYKFYFSDNLFTKFKIIEDIDEFRTVSLFNTFIIDKNEYEFEIDIKLSCTLSINFFCTNKIDEKIKLKQYKKTFQLSNLIRIKFNSQKKSLIINNKHFLNFCDLFENPKIILFVSFNHKLGNILNIINNQNKISLLTPFSKILKDRVK